MENDHQNIIARLDEQGKKIDDLYISTEKTRKYFLVTMWITIILFVLPLLALVFVIPMFITTYMTSIEAML